jgi:hypothetical protein
LVSPRGTSQRDLTCPGWPCAWSSTGAVDQREPVRVADHHHRNLLSDLGDRADEPPALLAVVNPQILVPKLEFVEVHFHAVNLHLCGRDGSLVLPRHPH